MLPIFVVSLSLIHAVISGGHNSYDRPPPSSLRGSEQQRGQYRRNGPEQSRSEYGRGSSKHVTGAHGSSSQHGSGGYSPDAHAVPIHDIDFNSMGYGRAKQQRKEPTTYTAKLLHKEDNGYGGGSQNKHASHESYRGGPKRRAANGQLSYVVETENYHPEPKSSYVIETETYQPEPKSYGDKGMEFPEPDSYDKKAVPSPYEGFESEPEPEPEMSAENAFTSIEDITEDSYAGPIGPDVHEDWEALLQPQPEPEPMPMIIPPMPNLLPIEIPPPPPLPPFILPKPTIVERIIIKEKPIYIREKPTIVFVQSIKAHPMKAHWQQKLQRIRSHRCQGQSHGSPCQNSQLFGGFPISSPVLTPSGSLFGPPIAQYRQNLGVARALSPAVYPQSALQFRPQPNRKISK